MCANLGVGESRERVIEFQILEDNMENVKDWKLSMPQVDLKLS